MNQKKNDPSQPLQEFLEEELNSIRGLWYPVKPSLLNRLLVRHARVTKLHPNPDDEFCNPKIGPHYGILAEYEREMRRGAANDVHSPHERTSLGEPLEVQKIRPDGYMILNGHHRWAAARRAGVKRLRIHIVRLTLKTDIELMLTASSHNRRVTFDLDETVFQALPGDENGFEKPLRLRFLRRAFPERLRRGIPSLFRYLTEQGYDVWVYTPRYYSLDRLKLLFQCYSCPVAGMITGVSRKSLYWTEQKKELESLMNAKYQSTVHVDSETVLKSSPVSRTFVEVPLNLSAGSWSQAVMNAFDELKKTAPDPEESGL